jgi:hypothetical protein
MKSIILSFLLAFLYSCSESKYEMYDLANDCYISIDHLIENGEYKHEICEDRIDRIFKSITPTIDENLYKELNSLLDNWATQEEKYLIAKGDSTTYAHYDKDILFMSNYLYTYIISNEPVHVFSTCTIEMKPDTTLDKILFIRIDETGKIIGDYSDINPVQNSCYNEPKCQYIN